MLSKWDLYLLKTRSLIFSKILEQRIHTLQTEHDKVVDMVQTTQRQLEDEKIRSGRLHKEVENLRAKSQIPDGELLARVQCLESSLGEANKEIQVMH